MATVQDLKAELGLDNIQSVIEMALEIDWKAELESDSMHWDMDLVSVHDMLSALYWYCTDNHGGQGSQEYALVSGVLSQVYFPGCRETGPEPDSCAMDTYNELMEMAD